MVTPTERMNKEWSKLSSRIQKVIASASNVCEHQCNHETLKPYASYFNGFLKDCNALKTKLQTNPDEQLEETIEGVVDVLMDWELFIAEKMSLGVQSSTTQNESSKLQRVTLRQFDSDNPTIWFKDLEIQFLAMGIHSQIQKFASLNGLLDSNAALVVHPVTDEPNNNDPYNKAKQLLLNAYSLSMEQRLDKAFALQLNLEGEKPSQYLSRFRLLCDHCSIDDIERWFISKALPEDVRLNLKSDKTIVSADEFVREADKLVQTKNMDVANIGGKRKFNGHKKRLCYFHERYGDKAKKCAGSDTFKCDMNKIIAVVETNSQPSLQSGNEVDGQLRG